MKIVYSYVFTKRNYECSNDEQLAKMLGLSSEATIGACEFAKLNNDVCYTRLDPYSKDLMNKQVLVFAKTAEDLETLIQDRYNLVLNDTYNSTGKQQ